MAQIEFFIAFYELLEEDLIKVIKEERRTRKVLGVFNSTFPTLIPKKDEQELLITLGCYPYVIVYI
jgi:hypothetical protein